jgi:hypothetical protein
MISTDRRTGTQAVVTVRAEPAHLVGDVAPSRGNPELTGRAFTDDDLAVPDQLLSICLPKLSGNDAPTSAPCGRHDLLPACRAQPALLS